MIFNLTYFDLEDYNQYTLAYSNFYWRLYNFSKTPIQVQVSVTSATTQKTISVVLYPNNNEFLFNPCAIVRKLFVTPTNTQNPFEYFDYFTFTFNSIFTDLTTDSEPLPEVIFIKGYSKRGLDKPENQYYLLSGDFLTSNEYWYSFDGVIPSNPYIISGGSITTLGSFNVKDIPKNNCNGKMIKFINRRGGVQYWWFDYVSEEDVSKGSGIIKRIQQAYADQQFNNLKIDVSKEVTLSGRVKYRDRAVLEDLANAIDVSMVTSNGNIELINLGNKVEFDNKDAYKDVTLKFGILTDYSIEL